MATSRRPPSVLLAYVLHRYDWSESSLILDVFTREQGRLIVAAKGAKRPYSQLRSVLLPFQRLNISLGRAPKPDAIEGAGSGRDVQTLRSAEWAGGAAMLTGAALFSGFYLNELLMKLLARHDAHAALFDAYAVTLPVLASGDESSAQSALRAFEITLLQQTGVLPDLSQVTTTLESLAADTLYAVLPEAGVARARSGEPGLPGSALIGVQAALLHGSLQAVAHACSANLPEWRHVLRALLHYHLGGPALRTRKVMLELQGLSTPGHPASAP